MVYYKEDVSSLSNEYDEENDCWNVYAPANWGEPAYPLDKQRMITRYINNLLPKVADKFFPSYYESVLSANELPKGKCRVKLEGNGEWYKNDEGGYDVVVPFTLIKLPFILRYLYLLKPYVEPGSDEEKMLKRYKDFKTYGETTYCVDYKLLTSELKRKSLRNLYGEKLFVIHKE